MSQMDFNGTLLFLVLNSPLPTLLVCNTYIERMSYGFVTTSDALKIAATQDGNGKKIVSGL